MSPAPGLKRALFAGGVLPRTLPHSPLYDRAEVTGRSSPVEDCGSSCSSSIGRNSDCLSAGSGDESSGEAEVQSALKGPLDTMDVLEFCLPIKSVTPNFYRGKSKPFSNVYGISPRSADARLAYTSSDRKRKNHQPPLYSDDCDTNAKTPPKAPSYGRLPKRVADLRHSMPNPGAPGSDAAASSSSGSNNSATSFEEDHDAVTESWLLAARCR